MGWGTTAAKKAGRAAGRAALRAGTTQRRGFVTEDSGGPVYCRCGRRVRSRLGDVCSSPACHDLAVND